jgi:hypothetical protein
MSAKFNGRRGRLEVITNLNGDSDDAESAESEARRIREGSGGEASGEDTGSAQALVEPQIPRRRSPRKGKADASEAKPQQQQSQGDGLNVSPSAQPVIRRRG